MANRPILSAISRFFRVLYLKLFRINDTPQKIALGFGIGVFLGVLPGAGPIAAFTLALLLKVNRAGALLGSVLTNTWLSIPVFLLSLKAGAMITGVRYQDLHRDWLLLIKDFQWASLFDVGAHKILLPTMVGYAVVSFVIAVIAYLIVLIIAKYVKLEKRKQVNPEK